ncbi:lysophospholipid acyltransferase family protein [Pseudomonas oryzihabitans]|uniref:lysophospholipid acyltransferase family protein n=1 Tax=Pseudomonas oryzihabitans TaxID=47885 RepID=UPI00111D5F65|nr:lysophospholipid acyltransferase family protein [Pseudomonas psychrotolerans]QDD91189.1 1-acyl-sn-glycerol-3-phosphate acyltransferase [Pseudomonas psychrotolerans]
MRRVRLAIRLLPVLAALLLGALFALTVALATALTRHPCLVVRQHLTRRFFQALSRALRLRLEVHGAPPQGTHLWLANHVSWLDIVGLGSLRPLSFLSKAEVADWPFAGWLTRQAGTLFIQRGAERGDVLSEALTHRLTSGLSLALFPEGTTTDGSQLRTFHGRLLSPAIATGTPLQPVALSYWRDGIRDQGAAFIGDDDLVSHLRRLLDNGGTTLRIEFLPPVACQDRPRQVLAGQCQAAIAERLGIQPISRAAARSAAAKTCSCG